jgi:hypothetical protein
MMIAAIAGIIGEGALTPWLLFKGVAVPGPARSA